MPTITIISDPDPDVSWESFFTATIGSPIPAALGKKVTIDQADFNALNALPAGDDGALGESKGVLYMWVGGIEAAILTR